MALALACVTKPTGGPGGRAGRQLQPGSRESVHRWLMEQLGGARLLLGLSSLRDLDAPRGVGEQDHFGATTVVLTFLGEDPEAVTDSGLFQFILSPSLGEKWNRKNNHHVGPSTSTPRSPPIPCMHKLGEPWHCLPPRAAWSAALMHVGWGRAEPSLEGRVLMLSNSANTWRHRLPAKGVAPRSGREDCN